MADLYSDPNQDPTKKKPGVPGQTDPNALGAMTNGLNPAGGANGGIQTVGGASLNNSVTAPTGGFDPNGSQQNVPPAGDPIKAMGGTTSDPGGMAGGNMPTPSPTDPADVPPVAGWVRYGNGGWAPPEIVNGAAAGGGVTGPANPGPAAPGPTAPPAGGITTAGQVTSTPTTVGGTTPSGSPTTIAQSYQQSLVNRLNPQAVTADDPSIRPAIQANQLAEQRGMEQQRQALAEQGAKDNSGVDNAQLLGLMQSSAGRQGQFNAGAIQHLSDLQNQNETSAEGLAGGQLNANQQADLQRYLGDQSAALQRQSIEQQGSLGSGDLALRGRLGDAQANLGLLGLLQGGDQFGRQLNQQGAQFGAGLDQSGLLGLLGLL